MCGAAADHLERPRCGAMDKPVRATTGETPDRASASEEHLLPCSLSQFFFDVGEGGRPVAV